jgi:hypothetical protein
MALGVYKMKKSSPMKFWQAMALGAGASILGGMIGRKGRRRELAAARKAEAASREQWMGLDTSNIYANLENVYEDLTVNQQQAQFMKQQQQQQQANVLEGLRGTAGGAGVASLAQVMANQGQVQAQQASASIGQQEAANRRMRAQGAARTQQMELAGAEQSRQLQYQKAGTIFGMDMQRLTAAQQARNEANQAIMKGIGQAGGAIAGYGMKEGWDWRGTAGRTTKQGGFGYQGYK